jgi:uncharacterized membrane protein
MPIRTAPLMLDRLLFVAFVIAAQIPIALVMYPFMPATVPTHWDAAGHVNGYGPKWVDTFLFPAINPGLFLLLRLLLNIGPRLGSTNRRTNVVVVDRILAGVFLLMLIVHGSAPIVSAAGSSSLRECSASFSASSHPCGPGASSDWCCWTRLCYTSIPI